MCARLRAVERLAQQYTQSRITQIDGCTRKYSGALSCTHERNIGYFALMWHSDVPRNRIFVFYALLWHENCGNSVVSEYVPCHATAKTVNVHDCAHIWTAAYMHVGADNKRVLTKAKTLMAEDTRFCAECEKSLIFRQFSRLQGDDATVIPTVYTGQHVPSSSATVNSTIIPIVVCMTLKQLPMARSALQEGRLSCQQRSLLGIWNLSP